jgi:hypothetical protein
MLEIKKKKLKYLLFCIWYSRSNIHLKGNSRITGVSEIEHKLDNKMKYFKSLENEELTGKLK